MGEARGNGTLAPFFLLEQVGAGEGARRLGSAIILAVSCGRGVACGDSQTIKLKVGWGAENSSAGQKPTFFARRRAAVHDEVSDGLLMDTCGGGCLQARNVAGQRERDRQATRPVCRSPRAALPSCAPSTHRHGAGRSNSRSFQILKYSFYLSSGLEEAVVRMGTQDAGKARERPPYPARSSAKNVDPWWP